MTSTRSSLRGTLLRAALLAGALGLVCAMKMRHLGSFLTGAGDVPIWEYVSFYVGERVTFDPLPELELQNDSGLYPYGTSQVFQPWAFERDFFAAVLRGLFGFGPWLQTYFLLSLTVSAVGTYGLLRRSYGDERAFAAGMAVTFLNFYAIYKYPVHLHAVILHWTTLSLIADFSITSRAVDGEWPGVRLLLFRAALVPLALGQDLGYIAGYALTSGVLCVFVVAVLGVTRYRRGTWHPRTSLRAWASTAAAEARRHPVSVGVTLGVSVIASFVYVPLVLQVHSAANAFDFHGVPMGRWWASPLRLFIPQFPFAHGEEYPLRWLLRDNPEGRAAGGPGWSLVILGGIGIWHSRRHFTRYVAVTVLFAACLFDFPAFSVLKIFPWFQFSRVGPRSTVIYPVILVLYALAAPRLNLSSLRSRLAAATLGGVLLLEVATVYTFPPVRTYEYSAEVFAYLRQVERTPGEAILDWPFCVTGGNGVGSQSGLCPYYRATRADFTHRMFHRKKVVGTYYGRLHPDQIRPFLRDGWNRLLAPESERAGAPVHCFSTDEWAFFERFLNSHDFAGVQLHTPLISPACSSEFHRRLGEPVARADVPGSGPVEFIPRRDRSASASPR